MKSKSSAVPASAGVLLTTLASVLVGTLGFGSPAHAQTAEGLALAQQQNCMSCHSVTRPFMGPALHDVAAKYAGRDDAKSYLKRKILDGSTGVWGIVPMPANTQLTAEQAATLANWVLTLK
jgi:cytochrome c